MTTVALITVIVILVWNLAVLYLPFRKGTRAKLSFVSFAILIVFCLFSNGEQADSKQDIYRQIAWNKTHHPQTAKAMMVAFNVSEKELKTETPTPIEAMVFAFLAVAIISPILIIAVVKEADDDEMIKVQRFVFCLNVVATAFLLSLYFGLELTIVPWYKKVLKEGKTSPALT